MKKYFHKKDRYIVTGELVKRNFAVGNTVPFYRVFGYGGGKSWLEHGMVAMTVGDFEKLFEPVEDKPQSPTPLNYLWYPWEKRSAHDLRAMLRKHRLDDWQQLSPDPTFVPDRVDYILQAVDWLLAQVEKVEEQ